MWDRECPTAPGITTRSRSNGSRSSHSTTISSLSRCSASSRCPGSGYQCKSSHCGSPTRQRGKASSSVRHCPDLPASACCTAPLAHASGYQARVSHRGIPECSALGTLYPPTVYSSTPLLLYSPLPHFARRPAAGPGAVPGAPRMRDEGLPGKGNRIRPATAGAHQHLDRPAVFASGRAGDCGRPRSDTIALFTIQPDSHDKNGIVQREQQEWAGSPSFWEQLREKN
jgi:hypothetical protein